MSPRWPGAVLTVLWAWLAVEKFQEGLLPELLWGCHVAALTLALGFLLRIPALIGAGALFHLGFGLPCWLIELFLTQQTRFASAALHLACPALGLWALRQAPWPRSSWLFAWFGFASLIALSYSATDPALNINAAHAPWHSFLAVTPTREAAWIVNGVGIGPALWLIDRVFRRGFERA